MEELKKRVANLLTVKSIVTVVLTVVFAYLACGGQVSTDQFLTVFSVVIAFYFGTHDLTYINRMPNIVHLFGLRSRIEIPTLLNIVKPIK